jgi:CubicO group peptidase (beta-lactamase class C family)
MRPSATLSAILVLLAGLSLAGAAYAQQSGPGGAAASHTVWPGQQWETATPESQGLSGATLDAAAAYADKHGGGSGCVIRHGYLVKEWGSPTALADIKSATKGAFGATILGLAVDAGLVGLDDKARMHSPQLGDDRSDNRRDWLGEIMLRHLATMTAGFDDSRPAKLVNRPGTAGIYSNDTSNMLAELLTLKFGEDLESVMRRKVLDPIGVSASEWRWRDNAYRPKTINGLKTREFASGIKITHRALARIGYLYLREGRWDGRTILSKEFINAATRPTDLPAPYPYYGFYWGSNAKGQLVDMPRDAYWALGLGDSMLIVCPSLDIVAVRLGTGSTRSQLPPFTNDWDKKVEGFFRLVARAVCEPYPPSVVIPGLTWAPANSIVRKATDSDNWPLTWADDDYLYTAYGDGTGFIPKVPEKLSLGLARIEGGPGDFQGFNIRSPTCEQKGNGKNGLKGSGLLMVEGILYLWARNAGNARLTWSSDHGSTWKWSDWKLATSFGCPTFLNFGRNYAGARDHYVYIYSHDSDSAYLPADRVVLARVPKDRIRDRTAYSFFVGSGLDSGPVWSAELNERGAVFQYPGKCYRTSVSYHAQTGRYLLCQTGTDASVRAGFGIYDAPEPWGPWTTVYKNDAWDVSPGESCAIPTKWMDDHTRSIYLVFSGDDSFSVRRATLRVAAKEDGAR